MIKRTIEVKVMESHAGSIIKAGVISEYVVDMITGVCTNRVENSDIPYLIAENWLQTVKGEASKLGADPRGHLWDITSQKLRNLEL